MARGRMLSKSLSTSTKRARLHRVLGPLAEFAQALYPLLVAHADDWGREVADPFTVKNTVDPSSPRPLADFVDALVAMEAVGLVKLYQDGARIILQVNDFDEHQTGLHKRTPSKFAESPSQEVPGNSREFLSRARAELELELELKDQNALRAKIRPQKRTLSRPLDKPKVPTLAAMVRDELLPRGITDEGDLVEAAKKLAASLHLKYSGSAIRKAIASANAQAAKRRQA